jgi:hypothetical protein
MASTPAIESAGGTFPYSRSMLRKALSSCARVSARVERTLATRALSRSASA